MDENAHPDGDPDYYVNPFARPVYITGIWLITFVMIMLLHYGMLTNWQHTFIFYFGSIFFGLGTILFIKMGLGFFTQSFEIWIRDNGIETRGLYGQKWDMEFDDIKTIIDPRGFISISGLEFHSIRSPDLKIRVNDTTLGFGEMAERIMEKAINVEKIDLGELADFPKLWKKEPDKELIERAKQRAAENSARGAQSQHT